MYSCFDEEYVILRCQSTYAQFSFVFLSNPHATQKRASDGDTASTVCKFTHGIVKQKAVGRTNRNKRQKLCSNTASVNYKIEFNQRVLYEKIKCLNTNRQSIQTLTIFSFTANPTAAWRLYHTTSTHTYVPTMIAFVSL